MRILICLFFLSLFLISCNSTPVSSTNLSVKPVVDQSVQATSRIGTGKPSKTQAMRMVFEHHRVLLKDMQFCESELLGQNDQSDIGDLFSHILMVHGESIEQQYTDIRIIQGEHADYKEKLWKIIVLQHIYIKENDAYTAWGISFLIKDSDHKAIASSFSCAGIG